MYDSDDGLKSGTGVAGSANVGSEPNGDGVGQAVGIGGGAKDETGGRRGCAGGLGAPPTWPWSADTLASSLRHQ